MQRAFSRPGLPVPEVLEAAEDGALAFCISRRAPGRPVNDLDPAGASGTAPAVAAVLAAVAASDLAGTGGFGCFDGTGAAPHASWRGFLLSIAGRDWAPVRRRVDPALLDGLLATVAVLAPRCPEARALVHGDSGGSNVLGDGRLVTAVIDWDLALFGDPLYDRANIAFWDEERLRPSAALAPRHLPAFGERMRCYMARIGLEEIHASATGRFPDSLDWLVPRCAALVP